MPTRNNQVRRDENVTGSTRLGGRWRAKGGEGLRGRLTYQEPRVSQPLDDCLATGNLARRSFLQDDVLTSELRDPDTAVKASDHGMRRILEGDHLPVAEIYDHAVHVKYHRRQPFPAFSGLVT